MRKVLAGAVIVIAVCAVASADIGTPSISMSASFSGYEFNANIDASSTGFATASVNDLVFAYAVLFYPPYYGPPFSPAYFVNTKSTIFRADHANPATDTFDESFNFSLSGPSPPIAGNWQAQWGCAFYSLNSASTDFTTVDSTRQYGVSALPAATYTPDPNAGGEPIPTLSMPSVLLLGLLMVGAGILILRRR